MENANTDQDKVRQLILLETENLKFAQVFFLPVFSGIFVVSLTNSEWDPTTIAFWNLGAFYFFYCYFFCAVSWSGG